MVFTSQQAFTSQCAVLTHKQALNSRSIHDFGSSRVLPMQIICKILDYVNIFLRKVLSFCEVLRGVCYILSPYPQALGSVREVSGERNGLQQGPWPHCVTH